MTRRLCLTFACWLLAAPVAAQVAFDASSESHTGTTGSASEASFSWTHTPVGTPKGVLVCTFVNANADDATAVTYGGSSLTAVTGGRQVDTAGEAGDSKLWFLGSSIPTGAQSVVVTRTNNANVMYAVAFTVTASGNTATAGVGGGAGDGPLTEQSVDDGSPGSNSVRFACVNSGLASVSATPAVGTLAPGTNSTLQQSIDLGARVIGTVSETTAGQGSRSVGFDSSGSSDDTALVQLAITDLGGPAAVKTLLLMGVGAW